MPCLQSRSVALLPPSRTQTATAAGPPPPVNVQPASDTDAASDANTAAAAEPPNVQPSAKAVQPLPLTCKPWLRAASCRLHPRIASPPQAV